MDAPRLPVTYADVVGAAERLMGVVHVTPVGSSTSFNRAARCEAFFKCESFQRTGSFKIRGAFNACSKLDAEARAHGVLTFSSGNHGQAVALAARLLSMPAVVVMPRNAPAVKRHATIDYGAEVIDYDPTEITREELAMRIAEERSLTLVPPYNHRDVVAGQGTVAYELLGEVADLDMLLVPCGGGGLLSGSAITASALQPSCRIIGVEPSAADDATRSFRTGILQSVSNPDTVADGARTPSLGTLTFPIVRALVDDMVTVDDTAIIYAMRFIWERMKLVVEPTGALAAAALLSGAVPADGLRVGVILSGGNVDLDAAARLFA